MKFSRKKEEILDPYTVERCNSCNVTHKRKFKEGDFVFKSVEKCSTCDNGKMIISQIFGEVVKQ